MQLYHIPYHQIHHQKSLSTKYQRHQVNPSIDLRGHISVYNFALKKSIIFL